MPFQSMQQHIAKSKAWDELHSRLKQAAEHPNKFPHVDNKTVLQMLFIMQTLEVNTK